MTAGESQSRARRIARYFFALIVAVVWLVIVAALLEAYARYDARRLNRDAESKVANLIQWAFEKDRMLMAETRATAPAPPCPRPPLRKDFVKLDEAGRADFALRRNEQVFVCGLDGVIQAYYPSPEPKIVADFVKAVHVGDPVVKMLPPTEAQDAAAAVQTAATGNPTSREYEFPLPDGQKYCFYFYFQPIRVALEPVKAVAVIVRESIYEERWQTFRKNVSLFDEDYEFWTNSQGFRCNEVALPKPPGVFRIVCVGGSTTVDGPRNDLTYPSLLQKKLREHFHTDAIEVINAGVIALGSTGEFAHFQRYLDLQPDLILHYNFVNEVYQIVSAAIEPKSFWSLRELKWLLRKSTFMFYYLNRWILPTDAELRARMEEMTFKNLAGMHDACVKAGVKMAICSFAYPDFAHLDRAQRNFFDLAMNRMNWAGVVDMKSYVHLCEMYDRLLPDFCKNLGVFYVPVGENMKGGINYFTDICHTHVEGCDAKAGIISDHLKDFIAPMVNARLKPAR